MLPFAITITLVSGTLYITFQQDIRVNRGNLPQAQLAEDIAVALEAGADPRALLQANTAIDFGKSLAPYAIVFNDNGQPIVSSGALDGNVPNLPAGVLDYTRAHREDRITWEPKPGVRSAIVIVRYEGKNPGFILVGRSLRDVEEEIGRVGHQIFIGWLGSLIVLAAAFGGLDWMKRRSIGA